MVYIYNIYKVTLKNLLRAPLFWSMVIVSSFIIICRAIVGPYTVYDTVYGLLDDNDPRFIPDLYMYWKSAINAVAAVSMDYIMPLFAVVSTVIILNRDYDDDFYEIEKSMNLSPFSYLFARLIGLLTVNFIMVTFISLLRFHLYFLIRNDIKFMGPIYYSVDSFIRIFRFVIIIAMPCIATYIVITYLLGSIIKNGITAGIISTSIIVVNYLYKSIFHSRFPSFINEYIAPIPENTVYYFYYYDTPSFDGMLKLFNVSFKDVIVYISLFFGTTIMYSIISYFIIRSREI